jgi:hypothetical protein
VNGFELVVAQPSGAGSGKTANAIDPAILSALRQGFSLALYDFKFGTGG